jgi:hypothetical protein
MNEIDKATGAGIKWLRRGKENDPQMPKTDDDLFPLFTIAENKTLGFGLEVFAKLPQYKHECYLIIHEYIERVKDLIKTDMESFSLKNDYFDDFQFILDSDEDEITSHHLYKAAKKLYMSYYTTFHRASGGLSGNSADKTIKQWQNANQEIWKKFEDICNNTDHRSNDIVTERTTMIDLDKEYRTKDGCEVKLSFIDDEIVYGHYKSKWDCWVACEWSVNDGEYYRFINHEYDLIEVKPRIKRTVWINVYKNFTASDLTKESADTHSCPDRIACVKVEIDCEEGEGL